MSSSASKSSVSAPRGRGEKAQKELSPRRLTRSLSNEASRGADEVSVQEASNVEVSRGEESEDGSGDESEDDFALGPAESSLVPESAPEPVPTLLTEEEHAAKETREMIEQAKRLGYSLPADFDDSNLLTMEGDVLRPQRSVATEGFYSPESNKFDFRHQVDSLNRAIEAEHQTSIFRAVGYYGEVDSTCHPYTRAFEAVGDFVPNILAVNLLGERRYVMPHKWLKVRATSEFCRLASLSAEPPKGFLRYRLLNGKMVHVQIQLNDKQIKKGMKIPIFLKFVDLDGFKGFAVRGVRADASYSELTDTSLCTVREEPLEPEHLFMHAVHTAEESGRTAKEVQLASYFRPSRKEIGYSKEADLYLESHWEEQPLGLELTSSSYKDNLLRVVRSINSKASRVTDANLLAAWNELTKFANPDMTEEDAKVLWDAVLSAKTNGKYSTNTASVITNLPVHVAEKLGPFAEPASIRNHFEVHLDGLPHLPLVKLEGDLLLGPYSFTAKGMSSDADALLAGLPRLLSLGLRAAFGSYLIEGESLVTSVTPHKKTKDRGTGEGNLVWQEKLHLTGTFHGPLFFVGMNARTEHCEIIHSYAVAFNTLLLQEATVRGVNMQKLLLTRPNPGFHLPMKAVSPYFGGIGLHRGEIIACPLTAKAEDFYTRSTPDLRRRLPARLLRALIESPNRVQLEDPVGSVVKENSLILVITNEDGTRSRHAYTPKLTVIGTCLMPMTGSRKGDELPVDEEDFLDLQQLGSQTASVTSAKGKSKGKGRAKDAESTITKSEAALPSIARATVPFGSLQFTDRVVYPRAGDWKALQQYWEEKKRDEKHFRKLYTLHYQHANSGLHTDTEAIVAHNPRWSTSLKKTPMIEKFAHDGIIVACKRELCMSGDDSGHGPMDEVAAQLHQKAKSQRGSTPTRGANARGGQRGGRGRGTTYSTNTVEFPTYSDNQSAATPGPSMMRPPPLPYYAPQSGGYWNPTYGNQNTAGPSMFANSAPYAQPAWHSYAQAGPSVPAPNAAPTYVHSVPEPSSDAVEYE